MEGKKVIEKDGILTCDRKTSFGFINNLSKLFELFRIIQYTRIIRYKH